jgi:hypothetical protein
MGDLAHGRRRVAPGTSLPAVPVGVGTSDGPTPRSDSSWTCDASHLPFARDGSADPHYVVSGACRLRWAYAEASTSTGGVSPPPRVERTCRNGRALRISICASSEGCQVSSLPCRPQFVGEELEEGPEVPHVVFGSATYKYGFLAR